MKDSVRIGDTQTKEEPGEGQENVGKGRVTKRKRRRNKRKKLTYRDWLRSSRTRNTSRRERALGGGMEEVGGERLVEGNGKSETGDFSIRHWSGPMMRTLFCLRT